MVALLHPYTKESCTLFQNVDTYAGDTIHTRIENYKQNPRANRINLSICLYYNAQAIIPPLQAVAEAQAILLTLRRQARRPICRWKACNLPQRDPGDAIL